MGGKFSLQGAVANQQGNAEGSQPKAHNQNDEPFRPANPGAARRQSRIKRLGWLDGRCVCAGHVDTNEDTTMGAAGRYVGLRASRSWPVVRPRPCHAELNTENTKKGKEGAEKTKDSPLPSPHYRLRARRRRGRRETEAGARLSGLRGACDASACGSADERASPRCRRACRKGCDRYSRRASRERTSR